MAKAKRWYFISAPGREVLHKFVAARFTEGEPTVCGVRAQKGWPFWYPNPKKPRWGNLVGRNCKRCFPASGEGKQNGN